MTARDSILILNSSFLILHLKIWDYFFYTRDSNGLGHSQYYHHHERKNRGG